MGNAWSFGSLVRGLNPRVQSWAEIPPGARPHKAEGLGKFVFWELLAPTKAKRESSRWNHNMKTYKQTNIDGLRKASDAPRHTMVDYIHIIFAHSTIPVCCMFLGVTVLNPKTSIAALRRSLTSGQNVQQETNRGGRWRRWPDVSMDVCPGWFCSEFGANFTNCRPHSGNGSLLKKEIPSKDWKTMSAESDRICSGSELQSTYNQQGYVLLFTLSCSIDLGILIWFSTSPTCEADSCTKWMSGTNHRGWMTGVWKPTTGVGFIIWGGWMTGLLRSWLTYS